MNFKFGVIYAKSGQRTDNEMYCNGKVKRLTVVLIESLLMGGSYWIGNGPDGGHSC